MADLSTTLGTSAPAEVPSEVIPRTMEASNVANKLAVGLPPTFLDRAKDALGAAQSAITSPLQSAGRSTAKALGASDETAGTVGASIPLVFVVLVAVVVAIAYKGGKFFGKRSIKL